MSFINLMIFNNHRILVRLIEVPKPVLGTQGVKKEYTLDGDASPSQETTNIHSHRYPRDNLA